MLGNYRLILISVTSTKCTAWTGGSHLPNHKQRHHVQGIVLSIHKVPRGAKSPDQTKSTLKDSQRFKGVYINEELSKQRREVFFQARGIAKIQKIKSTWTANGIILLKDHSDTVHRWASTSDVSKFTWACYITYQTLLNCTVPVVKNLLISEWIAITLSYKGLCQMMCRTQVLPRCYHVLCPLRVLFEYCKCYWFNTYSILPNQTLLFFYFVTITNVCYTSLYLVC